MKKNILLTIISYSILVASISGCGQADVNYSQPTVDLSECYEVSVPENILASANTETTAGLETLFASVIVENTTVSDNPVISDIADIISVSSDLIPEKNTDTEVSGSISENISSEIVSLIETDTEAGTDSLVLVSEEAADNSNEASSEPLVLCSAGTFSDLDLSDFSEIVIPENTDFSELYNETFCEEEVNEYSKLAIADVTRYVNVRALPDTDSEIVGYIYDGAVANIEAIAGDEDDWFKINSGNVTGYIKAEFFISGDDAEAVAGDYVTEYAVVTCDRLNVRKQADQHADRIGYAEGNEKFKIIEKLDEWIKIQYSDEETGYVSKDFVRITEEFIYARTLDEDKAIKEAEAELLARQLAENADKAESLTAYIDTSITPADSFASNAELRQSLIDYACSFVGNPYVAGGNSLTAGTDCSGFTMLIYSQFGYSISRIPQGQLDGIGRRISYDEIQPGDLVYYSSSGVKATHAAIYIGNGNIVHAANHRDGICISPIDWVGPVWGLKNVID